MLEHTSAALISSTCASGILFPPESVQASGGTTAGGAYLLSAKQRYNERVQAGVKGFVALDKALETGDIDSLRIYFTTEDKGGWKDLSTAGYLLANAFRRNSSAAPDTLPSVQKWKAFAAQVMVITSTLKKKDFERAKGAYRSSITALNEYLDKVELPSTK